jgi:hypothetical protein
MTVEGKRLEILDQDMKQKTLKYPNHFVNYELHAAQNGNQNYPDPSVLVAIPHEDASANDDNWRLTGGGPSVPPSGVDRPAPAGAGDSVLRSIGDR